MGTSTLGFLSQTECIGHIRETAAIVAPEPVDIAGIAAQKVGITVIVVIEEQGGHGETAVLHPGHDRNEHRIALIAVQRIGCQAAPDVHIEIAIQVIIRNGSRMVEVIAQDSGFVTVIQELGLLPWRHGTQRHQDGKADAMADGVFH